MSNESMPTGPQAVGVGAPSGEAPTPAEPPTQVAATRSGWDAKPPAPRPIFCWILGTATLALAYVAPRELPPGGPDTSGQVQTWLLLISVTILVGSLIHTTVLPSAWVNGLRITTAGLAVALAAYHGYLSITELGNRANRVETNFLPEEFAAPAFGLTIIFATVAICPWREAWALVMITLPIAMIAPGLDVLYPTIEGLPARIDVPSMFTMVPSMLLAPLLWLRASGRLPWLWFVVCLATSFGLFEISSNFSRGMVTNDNSHLAVLAFGSVPLVVGLHVAWLLEDWLRRQKAARTGAGAVAPAPATAG